MAHLLFFICIDGRKLDVSYYNEMKYLNCVIKETLRLYPSVPLIGRLLGEQTMINGIKLPVGAHVHILISALHRDPNHFPNPERFDPERFTLENSQNRHAFAYIPFSASQRNCIGNFNHLFCQLKDTMTEDNISS